MKRPTRAAPGTAIERTPARSELLAPEHVERIARAVHASHSPATLRAYESACRSFVAWTELEGLAALPAIPETVAAYLTDRAEARVSRATLSMARAAIAFAHRRAGQPNPCDHEGVRAALRGSRRLIAAQGRGSAAQAAGLTSEALAAIRATARQPRTGPSGRKESRERAKRRGDVDVALCTVMRDALLRRSEAAALRWQDVELRTDGTARVTISRSKTDQEGEGTVQYIGIDGAKALRSVRPVDAAPDARVFALRSGRQVSRRISAAATAAGLEGAFSGHSARIGMAQDLAASGTELPALMVAGRWESERMPAHYARSEYAGRGAVARYYGA